MDLVSSCKDKLAYFRIKELKDVLTELGLSKQGKKQDLVDRILTVLTDDRVSGVVVKKTVIKKDGVAKLVDDTYRKMQGMGAADVASKSSDMAPKAHGVSDRAHVKHKEENGNSHPTETIRCVCGSSLATDSMIKCEDTSCNVWQHMKCVIIPEKQMEGASLIPPETFYCELCRLSRADPFLIAVAQPLLPVKLNITSVPTDGSNPGQSIEKSFQLTRADKDMLAKPEYDAQAWCVLLNDKVPFRMHWPQYADLQVNGVPVRTINRPASQMLGANGRDDGPLIKSWARDGINKISLTGCDSRIFCIGVRTVKKRTLSQVLSMIPCEAEGEPFDDALARVRRCVGGGSATENADADSDIEVVADFITVNLRCPMSGLRMKRAGRFKPCAHMGCFDVDVFVEMNQRSRKWQCPICLKNYSLEKIVIDPFFNRITSKLSSCAEDVAEIELKPDGSWRAKLDGERRGLADLAQWHLPDGTICASTEAESKPRPGYLPIKQENGSDSFNPLKLGMRKKSENGGWAFNKSDGIEGTSSPYKFGEIFKSPSIIPMSSSATLSGRDCEDVSVNQNGDFSAVRGMEYNSIPLNNETQVASATAKDTEIIVLSDSDDEIDPQISSEALFMNNGPNNGVIFQAPQHGIPDSSYFENPALGNGGVGLYGNNDDDEYEINLWPLPTGGGSNHQGVSGFQFFGSDAEVTEPIVDTHPHHHDSLNNGSFSLNGLGNNAIVSEPLPSLATSSVQHSYVDNTNGLGDNSFLTYSNNGNDPSLQIFLPTRPSEASTSHLGMRDNVGVSPNGIRAEDWFSLSLGNSGGVGPSAAPNGLTFGPDTQSRIDTLAEAASSLPNMNENTSRRNVRERSESDSPFSFPRQRRSVRPRPYLSIDSDSE